MRRSGALLLKGFGKGFLGCSARLSFGLEGTTGTETGPGIETGSSCDWAEASVANTGPLEETYGQQAVLLSGARGLFTLRFDLKTCRLQGLAGHSGLIYTEFIGISRPHTEQSWHRGICPVPKTINVQGKVRAPKQTWGEAHEGPWPKLRVLGTNQLNAPLASPFHA